MKRRWLPFFVQLFIFHSFHVYLFFTNLVMIEPFCSVYTKSYRLFKRDPEPKGVKPCLGTEELGENFLPTDDSKAIYNQERDEAVIKELYKKRLVSIYQLSYRADKKSMAIDPNNLDDDQFMQHFNEYYSTKTHPVPRPLDSFRKIFGYSRFSDYYTGKSLYENTIGKEAYKYFKRDYDLGKSRLYYEKQLALSQEQRRIKKELDEENLSEPEKEKSETKEPKTDKRKICPICCEEIENSNSDSKNEKEEF